MAAILGGLLGSCVVSVLAPDTMELPLAAVEKAAVTETAHHEHLQQSWCEVMMLKHARGMVAGTGGNLYEAWLGVDRSLDGNSANMVVGKADDGLD